MPKHSESRLLPYPCQQLFQLVLDVERYPEFVPGYRQARVLQRSPSHLAVEQSIGVGPAVVTFRSVATVEATRRIQIASTDGPFQRLELEWGFAPTAEGCQVDFGVAYRLHGPLAGLVEHWLALSAPRLFDAFVQRAAGAAG